MNNVLERLLAIGEQPFYVYVQTGEERCKQEKRTVIFCLFHIHNGSNSLYWYMYLLEGASV
ncbi:hypothetical protein A6P54_12650 [Bacillus sp. MKU004]|nr:hypothetical protein A6P54_12650 [Bacillus sp. MKU004]